MLGEMARQVEDALHEVVEPRDLRLVRIEAAFLHALALIGRGIAAPDGAAHALGHILAEPQRLAHLPHRAAGAIMDDRPGDAGALAAIAPVHILDDFLAPLMLEVDIDVRRLLAFGREKAREEQIMLHRIDGGDAEQEADDRVGRTAAPLAKDGRLAILARIADDVVHGQEIMGVALLPDQREFLGDKLRRLLRQHLPVALVRRLHDQMLQPVLRCPAMGHGLMRIFILQMLKPKADAGEEALRLGHRIGASGKEPPHLGAVLQMPLGMSQK